MNSLMDLYLQLTRDTEPPVVFHRWSLLTAVGAMLGRRARLKYGHFVVYPNMFTLLVGVPATRKSTSIDMIREYISDAGYDKFAADRTTKEKFLMDLAGTDEPEFNETVWKGNSSSVESIMELNLWGSGPRGPTECYISADELTEFFGNDPVSFCRTLGKLWECKPTFEDRIKNTGSIKIVEPTVSLLGGITPSQLAITLPPELIGQGFFSRTLLIFSSPSGTKNTFPADPDPVVKSEFIARLKGIRNIARQDLSLTEEAKVAIDYIYKKEPPMLEDVKFEHYLNRRLGHLMKLVIILAVMEGSKQIDEQIVLKGNTLLSYVEQFMPKALGQFGRAKNSAVVHKVLGCISNAPGVMTLTDIWEQVHSDIERLKDLVEIIQGLRMAGKIQDATENKRPGFLPIKQAINDDDKRIVDFSLLTKQERDSTI